MTDVPLEVWEQRMQELIDKNLKSIKAKLQQLTVAHDAVAKQNKDALLELQQLVASLKVLSDVSDFSTIIEASQFHNKVTIYTQMLTEATATKERITGADNPLQLCVGFHNKWTDYLRSLGANFISY